MGFGTNSKQYIFEAEVMPYAVSLMLWKRHLMGKCIFVFIDNEGARSAWISGFAATKAAQHMLHLGTSAEAELCVHPFFARVPTHSNLGDAPSRGKFEVIEKLGGMRTRVPIGMIECLMKHGRWIKRSHSNASGGLMGGTRKIPPFLSQKKGEALISDMLASLFHFECSCVLHSLFRCACCRMSLFFILR